MSTKTVTIISQASDALTTYMYNRLSNTKQVCFCSPWSVRGIGDSAGQKKDGRNETSVTQIKSVAAFL